MPITFTDEERAQLAANHAMAGDDGAVRPVVRLFQPDGKASWLLTELDPSGRHAYGLADLGVGCPEVGDLDMTDIEEIRGALNLPIERDAAFCPIMTLDDYARIAVTLGRIQI